MVLARLRNPAGTSPYEQIAKALTGSWQDEQLFILGQALARYDFSTAQVQACDQQIAQRMTAMATRADGAQEPAFLPTAKPNAKSKHQPAFNARLQLARITGVDLVAVTGLAASSVQTSISEIGTDMRKFPTVKHVCSWLGLAPHNDISGGKVLRRRTLTVRNWAAQAFPMAAQAVSRSDNAFGAFFRSMRARQGPQRAIVATAHTLARVVYHLLTYREAFDPKRVEIDDDVRRDGARLAGGLCTAATPSERGTLRVGVT